MQPIHYNIDLCTIAQKNYKRWKISQLRSGLGYVVWCMLRYTHPIRPILDRYKNGPKGNNIKNLILVEESNRILRRKGVAASLYYLFDGYFPDVYLFELQH